jgi:hypothetical protein
MAITLGDITLPSDLHWPNQFEWYGATGSSERTLGGGLVVWTGYLSKGRSIDLVATETRGWLTYTQLSALQTLAQNPITYTLVIGNSSFQVMFRYEDAPCIDVVPLISSRINYSANDLFTGTIKLMEV